MKNWHKIKVTPEVTMLEAMRLIDTMASRFVVVSDQNDSLLGIITDGDVRRAILKGVHLESPVSEIMNNRPIRIREKQIPTDQLKDFMLENKIEQIPIVTPDNIITTIYILDDFNYENTIAQIPVVIMAGGLGSRLGDLTKETPKPMLKIGTRPILETTIDRFKDSGFKKFYISVNYKADIIKNHFKEGYDEGIEINYIEEKKRLGTAGSLTLLPQTTGPIIVINGDILTKVNFEKMLQYHLKNESLATMGVKKYEFQVPYGVVRVKGEQITSIDEKPTQKFFVNAGIYVIDSNALDSIPKDEYFEMTNLFKKIIESDKKTAVFPIYEYWLDIGKINDFKQAESEFETHFVSK